MRNRSARIVALALGAATTITCAHGRPREASPAPSLFDTWPPGASPREVGRRVAANFLPRENMLTPQDGTIHYSQACTWYGALTFAQLTKDGALRDALVRKFEPLLLPENARIFPMREHVDWSVFGIVPLEIHLQTPRPNLLALGKDKADTQWRNPTAEGLSPQARFWIDDMYMIASLQTQAFRATGDAAYLDRTAAHMVAYLDRLQQPNGLFFHGEKGRFFWGRGNGWMAAGMTELLRELPTGHSHHARILDGYKKMMAALLAHQDADGMWHQLVDRPDAWPETSGTGMFTFAMITGVKKGWLPAEPYGQAARRAWLALVGYLDQDGNVRQVCKGMGQRDTAEGYIAAVRVDGDFHGQAPLLWSASALLR